MSSLIHLNLFNNFITNLPAPLFQISTLKILNVDYNPIEFIPDEITNLLDLEEFTCTNTLIHSLPENKNTAEFLTSLPSFIGQGSMCSSSNKSPHSRSNISAPSSRNRSRKCSKAYDIFAMKEEKERLEYLGDWCI